MAMNAVMSDHSQIPAYGGVPSEGTANADDNVLPANNNNESNANSNSNNVNNDNPVAGDPGERRSSMPPAGYVPQHQPKQPPTPQQQQQQQLQALSSPSIGSANVPFGLGNNSAPMRDPLFHNPLAASFPWSIGSTDGSFALVNLQQHQQQMHMQQQQQELQLRQAMANVTVGDDAVQQKPSPSGPDGASDANNGNGDGNDHTTDSNSKIGGAAGQAAAVSASAKAKGATNAIQAAIAQSASIIRSGRSLYHDKLFHQSSSSVEGVLAATCDVMGFDIAEMWLRTGLKTHQLTNSHLRPTALQDSVRQDLVEVYYGEKSNERTHRLSPALCKKAKDANDVVWVTAHTQNGAEALRMSISNVRTAVAVPICHEASNTNVTIIYFSIRRIVLRPSAVEFLIHMSLSAAVTSVNALSADGLIDRANNNVNNSSSSAKSLNSGNIHGELSKTTDGRRSKSDVHANRPPSSFISYQRPDKTSVTGARLDLQWRQLLNVEYLTDGGNSWIHTAVFDGKPVVVKTLRPECQDTAVAINEIESEVAVHSRLNHPNIVTLIGAGWTSKKVRFIVLERLDGGTLTQMLGYDTRIRDRRRRFWRKKQLPYLDVLRCARSLACAMQYCNEQAVPGSLVLHRDLKPDNIGFSLDGKVKLIDFGLARTVENSDPKSNDVYEMSGETGSLRYMAPEVAEGLPYNHKADVYSFGIIFWEMNAGKRPFSGLSRNTFYEQVVHGGHRPHLSKKWPSELNKLVEDCWSADVERRPTFGGIVDRIDDLLSNEKGGKGNTAAKVGGKTLQRLTGIIDRHSTWF